jgi:hypothetical protein
MQHLRLAGILLAVPLAAALVAAVGCGGGDNKASEKGGGGGGGAAKGGGEKPSAPSVTPAGKKEELASTGSGTLKGKVMLEGDMPDISKDIIDPNQKDHDYCEKGPTAAQNWKIGKDKGVANVVVWVRAPKGKYFKVPKMKEAKEMVKIDQPFCAFEPHVVALYPSYYDGKKQENTGQTFEVVNSATIPHNTNWTAENQALIPGANVILDPKTGKKVIKVQAAKEKNSGGEQQVNFECNIHKWMKAYAWVFDHPYVAVTSGDKKDAADFGDYEIKDVPTGAEVEIVYWHESFGTGKSKVLKSIALKDGDNTENFTIKR